MMLLLMQLCRAQLAIGHAFCLCLLQLLLKLDALQALHLCSDTHCWMTIAAHTA